jgi:hypothetical protein
MGRNFRKLSVRDGDLKDRSVFGFLCISSVILGESKKKSDSSLLNADAFPTIGINEPQVSGMIVNGSVLPVKKASCLKPSAIVALHYFRHPWL